jgi:hypothetical protein
MTAPLRRDLKKSSKPKARAKSTPRRRDEHEPEMPTATVVEPVVADDPAPVRLAWFKKLFGFGKP